VTSCSARAVTVVIFGHFNRSFYLLTYLLTSFLWEPRVTFWLFLFRPSSGGQTPQPIFTQNGSDDVDSRKDVPFAVKIATFHTP